MAASTDDDFEAFLSRVSEISDTIKGLVSGTIDPESGESTEGTDGIEKVEVQTSKPSLRKKHVTDYNAWDKWQPENEASDSAVQNDDKSKPVDKRAKIRAAEAELHKQQGNEAFKMKEYESAAESYSAGLVLCPKHVVLLLNRAQAYLKIQEFSKAVKDCNKALDLEPNSLKGLVRRAQAYRGLSQYNEALQDIEAARKLSKHTEVQQLLLQIKQEKEVYDREQAVLNELRLNPDIQFADIDQRFSAVLSYFAAERSCELFNSSSERTNEFLSNARVLCSLIDTPKRASYFRVSGHLKTLISLTKQRSLLPHSVLYGVLSIMERASQDEKAAQECINAPELRSIIDYTNSDTYEECNGQRLRSKLFDLMYTALSHNDTTSQLISELFFSMWPLSLQTFDITTVSKLCVDDLVRILQMARLIISKDVSQDIITKADVLMEWPLALISTERPALSSHSEHEQLTLREAAAECILALSANPMTRERILKRRLVSTFLNHLRCEVLYSKSTDKSACGIRSYEDVTVHSVTVAANLLAAVRNLATDVETVQEIVSSPKHLSMMLSLTCLNAGSQSNNGTLNSIVEMAIGVLSRCVLRTTDNVWIVKYNVLQYAIDILLSISDTREQSLEKDTSAQSTTESAVRIIAACIKHNGMQVAYAQIIAVSDRFVVLIKQLWANQKYDQITGNCLLCLSSILSEHEWVHERLDATLIRTLIDILKRPAIESVDLLVAKNSAILLAKLAKQGEKLRMLHEFGGMDVLKARSKELLQ